MQEAAESSIGGGDWIPNSKIEDTWENQTLFDLEGKALESLNVFLTE